MLYLILLGALLYGVYMIYKKQVALEERLDEIDPYNTRNKLPK